jgi:DNA helicase-2/ATP-dependent DNA helicase PcrA
MTRTVEPGSEAARIIAAEERLLVQVQARLAADAAADPGAAAAERVVASDYDRELIELRDAIAEAKPEDLAPLVEQMTRLVGIRARLGRARSLPVDLDSPYFAHMVLRQGDAARDVLIGKRGFIDRQANVNIVDWRNAPVSQIYYRYEEGDDYDEQIDGRHLSGVIDVRRNLSISSARLRRIGSPQGTFVRDPRNVWHQAVDGAAPALQGGAGKAARAPHAPAPPRAGRGRYRGRLGVHHEDEHRADKHLPEIAALIDPEQFDLITQPKSGLVVIQGGAGSGKTTVALHRVAYLNFSDPQRFQTSRLLIVVPSEALVRYVSAVLPALGVRGVPVLTYARWARAQRRRVLPESSSRLTDETPDAVARTKKHPALLGIIERYVAEQAADAARALEQGLAAAPGGDAVLAAWRASEGEASAARLRSLDGWVARAGELTEVARQAARSVIAPLRARADDVVTDWAELMTDAARLAAGFRAAGAADVTDRDIADTVRWCAAQQAPAAEAQVDPDGVAIEAVDGRALDEGDLGGAFDAHDDPILLRLVQLRRGGLIAPSGKGGKAGADDRETWYEHVAIDEAQDRSAIEIKVLLEATAAEDGDPARRSATIAGDTAQRLVFDNSFAGWQGLLSSIGYGAVTVQPLRLSYRSTAEVMELARDILGAQLAPEEPLHARSGAPVELHELGDAGEAVAFLADALRALAGREPAASVAIIARHAAQADIYHRGLERAEVASLRRVRDQEFSFTPGVDVTDIAQVKGLEFDYVVLVDVNAATYPDTIESRHLLHIGATRAAHQLWLISTGPLSPLIASLAVDDTPAPDDGESELSSPPPR